MSTVAFPLASHLWCAIVPVGWDVSAETPETACAAPISFYFGDEEGIQVSFTEEGHVSFAKEGEYFGDKYGGRVLTDEQFFDEEEEEVLVEEVFPEGDFIDVPAIPVGQPAPDGGPSPITQPPPTVPVNPKIFPTPNDPILFPDVFVTTLSPITDPFLPTPPAPTPVPLPPAIAIVALTMVIAAAGRSIFRRHIPGAAA
ncbi:MAG: hypothetical protein MK180_16255 [Rhodobacteraceae bacterium]|nr:hypothetical protein [Paracoccaceae bacterium]